MPSTHGRADLLSATDIDIAVFSMIGGRCQASSKSSPVLVLVQHPYSRACPFGVGLPTRADLGFNWLVRHSSAACNPYHRASVMLCDVVELHFVPVIGGDRSALTS